MATNGRIGIYVVIVLTGLVIILQSVSFMSPGLLVFQSSNVLDGRARAAWLGDGDESDDSDSDSDSDDDDDDDDGADSSNSSESVEDDDKDHDNDGDDDDDDSDENKEEHSADNSMSSSSSESDSGPGGNNRTSGMGANAVPATSGSNAELGTRTDRDVTVQLGLWFAIVCESGHGKDKCRTTSVSGAVAKIGGTSPQNANDIVLSVWNTIRLEATIGLLLTITGLVCMIVGLNPCCTQASIPIFLAIPVMLASALITALVVGRTLLISISAGDTDGLADDASAFMTVSWGLMVSGCSVIPSLVVSCTLIVLLRRKDKLAYTKHWSLTSAGSMKAVSRMPNLTLKQEDETNLYEPIKCSIDEDIQREPLVSGNSSRKSYEDKLDETAGRYENLNSDRESK